MLLIIWFVFSISNLLGCFKQSSQTWLGCFCVYLHMFFSFFFKIGMLETAYRLKIMSSVSMSSLRCGVHVTWLLCRRFCGGEQALPGVLCFCKGLLLCVPPHPLLLCMGFLWLVAMTGLGPQASCVSNRLNEPYQKTGTTSIMVFGKACEKKGQIPS